MFAALPVALDVDDHAPVGAQLAHQHVDDRLQRPQVLAPPADQRTQVATRDIQHDGVAGLADADLAPDAHAVDQLADQFATAFGSRVGGCRRDGRGADDGRLARIDHRNLDDGLLRRLAEHRDVNVATALPEFDQGGVNRLVEGSASALRGPQFPGLHSCPQPVTKYCWIIATQFDTNQ